MNKQEFMGRLSSALYNMENEEKEDILYDYEEHFRIAAEKGKSEEETAKILGNPESLAKYYRANSAVNKAQKKSSVNNITKAIFSVIGLGFVNLVFILGPFLGIVGALIGLYAGAVGVILGGAAGFIAVFAEPLFPEYIAININQGAALFLCVGVTCLGLLMLIGCWALTKLLYKGTIKYLKFNLNIIQRQGV